MANRLTTLSGMVKDFSLENISDRCPVIWRDPQWMSEYTLCAPQLFTTRYECWWSVEVVTAVGTASFQTERLNIERLLDACRNASATELIYTEVDPLQVAERLSQYRHTL